MQPYCFPYIGYFQLINSVDKFVIYDDVNFINKGWVNRNKILINGSAQLFTIPLKRASQNKKINEIEIHNQVDWRGKLLKTIKMAYSRSPFFYEVFELLEEIISKDWVKISDLNRFATIIICEYLSVNTKIVPTSSEYFNENMNGQDRIIDICIKENAKEYINSYGGYDLYNKSDFKARNIELKFIRTTEVIYKQWTLDFVPYLSIIDLLMFNPKHEVIRRLQNYEVL